MPRAHGVSLTLTYHVYSQALASVTADVDDQGTSRLVSVYARKGDATDKLRGEITGCL